MYNKKICKPTTYAEVFRGKINVIFFNVKHFEFYFFILQWFLPYIDMNQPLIFVNKHQHSEHAT